MSEGAFDLMCALVLEDGSRWGAIAHDFQVEDAQSILLNKRPQPTYHFLTRARGSSKSTDIAGVALSWLAVDARPYANGHIVAANGQQAAIIIDAAHGLMARTPEFDGALIIESERIKAPNGAWVRILPQSDSGAWGLRDAHLLIADEFCQWPETRGAKRVWTALYTAAPKVADCKLVVLTTAGEPSHWTRDVFESCEVDPLWHVHEVPGASPWMAPEDLEQMRFQLAPSVFERLYENKWSEAEDSGISLEDWDIASALGYKHLPPVSGLKYIFTVDVGIVNDATVITIMHKEPMDPTKPSGMQRVVVDHVERKRGTKKKHVQLQWVEDFIAEQAPLYNRATVHADMTQFFGTFQSLNRRGIRTKEFKFTATSVGEIAAAITSAFRNHQIWVPNLPVLKQELLSVKLRESAPGVTRLDTVRGGHDDQAVTIGMGCKLLIGGQGIGSSFKEFMAQDTASRTAPGREEREQKAEVRRLERAIRHRQRMGQAQRTSFVKHCVHRWSPDRSRCVFCGTVPEPIEVG